MANNIVLCTLTAANGRNVLKMMWRDFYGPFLGGIILVLQTGLLYRIEVLLRTGI
jgi:hypothetical protein